MKKLIIMICVSLCSLFLIGCTSTSGSNIVTGTKRSAVNADEVKIYYQFPENYEVIGIVKATGESWTTQKSLDLAVMELKAQAGKIGANGVVITDAGAKNEGYVLIGNTVVSDDSQAVSGTAIYVYPNK